MIEMDKVPFEGLVNPSAGNFELMFMEPLGEKINGLRLLGQQVLFVSAFTVTRFKSMSQFSIQFQVDEDQMAIDQLQKLMRPTFFEVLVSMLNSQGKVVSLHRAKEVVLERIELPALDVMAQFGINTGRQVVTAHFSTNQVTATNLITNAS